MTSWQVPAAGAALHSVLVRIDLASGDYTVIADDPDADLWSPAISPDGSAVAFIRESYSSPLRAPRIGLGYLRFGEQPSAVAADWDRWPVSVTWSRDAHEGDALIVRSNEAGAQFRNLILTDAFHMSIEYWKRTSSFNMRQMAADEPPSAANHFGELK